MRMRASRDQKWTCNINTLWEAKIPDLPTLKEHLPEAVLVAFDTEGCTLDCGKMSELGFAALCTNIAISKLTIALQEKTKIKPNSGRIVYAQLTEVEELVRDFLSSLPGKGILVGYDLNREMRWISKTFPSLAPMFIAWVDVQELIYYRVRESSPTMDVYQQLGLSTALQTMGFSAPSRSSSTRAANDCCRILQVLAGLVQSIPFALPGPRGPRIPILSIYERLPQKKDKEKHPFALRIRASNGSRFPPRSPREVAEAFKEYDGLRAVGLNWQNKKVRRDGVRFWWLSFSTHEALDDFYRKIHGGVIEGIALCADLEFPA